MWLTTNGTTRSTQDSWNPTRRRKPDAKSPPAASWPGETMRSRPPLNSVRVHVALPKS